MSSECKNLTAACITALKNPNDSTFELSKIGQMLDKEANGAISNQIKCFGKLKSGNSRLIYGAHEEYKVIAVNFIENGDLKISAKEKMDLSREIARRAVGDGVGKLKKIKVNNIFVDSTYEPFACAEAAYLRNFQFDKFKSKKQPTCKIDQLILNDVPYSGELWENGKIFADAQNWARFLTECPANYLTPHEFASLIEHEFSTFENCTVINHDEMWIKQQKMNCFLSVADGSAFSAHFVEINYTGRGEDDQPDCILVGKGITFDTGGISLKPSSKMGEMRGDMGGAAAVVSTMKAIAQLSPKLNITAFLPICENAIGRSATRPSDVVVACNGKSVQVDNTDAEGRLILADAIAYASAKYNPGLLVTVATLTGAIGVALGPACSGVYTDSDAHWESLLNASVVTGDRMWRMPHFDCYATKMRECKLADLNNISNSPSAGSCTAAAFLREFNGNKSLPYMHLDIAAVASSNESQDKYLINGMTGRPTRTLIEFISRL